MPALRVDDRFVPNPLVETARWIDPPTGQMVYGEPKAGEARAHAKEVLAHGTVDLGPLDEAVDRMVGRLAATMPDCLTKTIESVRKHKLEHWDRNRESNRAWLALNMMTEAKAGFRAFHFQPGDKREVDFYAVRRGLAEGRTWDEAFFAELGVDDASTVDRDETEKGP